MTPAIATQTNTSSIRRSLFDVLDKYGQNDSVVSNDKYVELLSQTVRAMEDRLSALKVNRASLFDQIAKLDEDIGAAEADIEGMKAIWNRTPLRGEQIGEIKPLRSEKSFTLAIEYVLKTLGTRMSPPEIRDKMEDWGYDLSRYETDVVASIHSVLRRLKAKGYVREVADGARRKSYIWINPMDRNPGTALE